VSTPASELNIQVHGDRQISAADRDYASRKIAHVAQHARGPVLLVKVDVHHEPNPSRVRPASAKALLDVNGTLVRAHCDAPTLREAIDHLEERLLHRLEHESNRK
jgi:ribosome-associated translation inhibitor RaiA